MGCAEIPENVEARTFFPAGRHEGAFVKTEMLRFEPKPGVRLKTKEGEQVARPGRPWRFGIGKRAVKAKAAPVMSTPMTGGRR